MPNRQRERDFYNVLINKLAQVNIRAYTYGKSGFLPVGHKKRFDILLFTNAGPNMPRTIALEVKIGESFNDINDALHEQIPTNYIGKEFKCVAEHWQGVPDAFGFCTIPGIERGTVYESNHPKCSNFFVDRIAWALGIGVLYGYSDDIFFAWRNKYFSFKWRMFYYSMKNSKGERVDFRYQIDNPNEVFEW